MTENVTYLIDAQDKASAKVRKSKEEVKKMVTEVKDLGGKSKASAELVGTLANQIGSTGAGQAAGEVAQLVERISAFSEVARGGGKAAMFFKAGLVAATAVIAFKLGKAIGDVIFKTEKWKRKSEEAAQTANELADRQTAAMAAKLQQDIAFAKTLGEAGEQDKLNAMLRGARDSAAAAARNVEKLKEKIAFLRREDSSLNVGLYETINVNRIAAAESELEVNKKLLNAARNRADQLAAMTSPAAKQLRIAQERVAAEQRSASHVESIKNQLALAKAKGDERLRLELKLSGVLDSQLQSALRMRQEINAIRDAEEQAAKAAQAKKEAERKHLQQVAEAERARKKAAADRAREEQRIAQSQASTVDSIRLQLVEMAKGKRAADALRFQQQGFAEGEAKRLARGLERIRALQRQASQSSIPTQSLSAGADDRLSTGRAAAGFRKTAEAVEAERQTKLQARMTKALESLERFERERKQNQPQQLVVVGD